MTKSSPIIIALCGKGGVGKTSISALLTKILCQDSSKKILAIDADPAVGLASALGIQVKLTVDDIRNNFISRIKAGEKIDKKEIMSRLDYEMFEAISEKANCAFLAIGRPEQDGCYCQVNHLLKDIIKEIASNFDYVVIDGEAGIEQVNRRVMEMVTHLLLISDASAKGRNVIANINDVALKAIDTHFCGVILNRLKDESEFNRLKQHIKLPLIGWIPEDENLRLFDVEGLNFWNFPASPALLSLQTLLNQFLIKKSNNSFL
ncbi:MAG: AAA family ATPase [Desulfobacterales bacterium]|nr:AAA family ATPase [Desulfobacterales bacterium]MBF0397157.1 AAA family ATPase [Desulfobacterales bacterium]